LWQGTVPPGSTKTWMATLLKVKPEAHLAGRVCGSSRGVEVAGGPTRDKAIARYRELQSKYAAIPAGLEPHLVIKGIIGDMGAVHARVGTDTRAEGDKLCAKLRAAGWYCDVLRN
jgi:hypothetical protein